MLNGKMKRLDGSEQDLADYLGSVIMIVNVASYCGNTPQYKGLQSLYERYKDQGFVVLGFPANDFGRQEPGRDEEISQFCSQNYGVTFPMFSKITVKGAEKAPIYAELQGAPPPIGGEVTWNFQKFLIDRSGHQVAMFTPRTQPESPEVVGKIEELLR